jgi:hypothetical protein
VTRQPSIARRPAAAARFTPHLDAEKERDMHQRSLGRAPALLAALALAMGSGAAFAGSAGAAGAASPSAPFGPGAWAAAGAGYAAGVALSAGQPAAQQQPPKTAPMPQSSIYIEPRRPPSPSEERQQAAAARAIEAQAPWSARWAMWPVKLDANEDPRQAWARAVRAAGGSPSAGLSGRAPWARAESVALALPGLREPGAERSGSAAAAGDDDVRVGAAAFKGAAAPSCQVSASLAPRGGSRFQWGACEGLDWSEADAPAEMALSPGQAALRGLWSGGRLWVLAVSPQR